MKERMKIGKTAKRKCEVEKGFGVIFEGKCMEIK